MPSPAPKAIQEIQEVPLMIVGGNKFGRYPKISVEQTWNMIVSGDFLVDYSGYKKVLPVGQDAPGRGIYSSHTGDIIIAVFGSSVYSIDSTLSATFIGTLETGSGDVFIAENNNYQIGITDKSHLYVYNYRTPTTPLLQKSGTDFEVGTFPILTPGYISFQNTRLIIADLGTINWYLSAPNDATAWSSGSNSVGALQSKPDTVQAVVPVPGGGNNMIVFGATVGEPWQFTGAALFPYQRNSTNNIDYGCLNASSIAALENYVVWLSANEQSGATLMVYYNGNIKSISTDGMDFKFAGLTDPTNCTGFLFRQDGHLIYQFTFPDDNLSYAYDFNTQLFFTVTDEDLNYHIARNVVFFNNKYYFVSLKGSGLFEFSTTYPFLQYSEDDIRQMPRLRVCPPVRLPSQRMFIGKSLGFTVENGQPNQETISYSYSSANGDTIATESGIDIATEDGTLICTEGEQTVSNTILYYSENIDLSVSRDGGESFGASWRKEMNPTGKRKSRLIWQRLGQQNDVTYQIRFVGYGRFVATNGVLEIYN